MKKILITILPILITLSSCNSPPPEPKATPYPAKTAPSKQVPPTEKPTTTPENLYENPNSPNNSNKPSTP